MVALSLLLHASLFGIAYRLNLTMPHLEGPQTYYVDVVNLPVANPQAGTPSISPQFKSDPLPQKQEMSVPANAAAKKAQPVSAEAVKKEKAAPQEKDTGDDFNKRIAGLQRKSEQKHLDNVLSGLGKKGENLSRPGMPGGKGFQSGSDYASYIQSRLRDAFNDTIAFSSSRPEMVVKLRINRYGKVIGYRVERSSRDRQFEASVTRAIDLAGENFPPPPGGQDFEHGYIFRPEGVGIK